MVYLKKIMSNIFFLKYFTINYILYSLYIILMKNYFDKMNSKIKSFLSTIHDIYRHIKWTWLSKWTWIRKQLVLTYISPDGKYIIITKQKVKILWFCVWNILLTETYLRVYLQVCMWLQVSQGTVWSDIYQWQSSINHHPHLHS